MYIVNTEVPHGFSRFLIGISFMAGLSVLEKAMAQSVEVNTNGNHLFH